MIVSVKYFPEILTAREQLRARIKDLYLSPEGHLIATNGHALLLLKDISVAPDDRPGMVPVKIFELARWAITSIKPKPSNITIRCEQDECIVDLTNTPLGAVAHFSRKTSEDFPDVTHILNGRDGEFFTIGINALLLGQIAKAINARMGYLNLLVEKSTLLEKGSAVKPIFVEPRYPEGELTAVIMPVLQD